MRYLILPLLVTIGCTNAPPVEYTHTGPNCFSLDPAYYRTLSDEDLAYCAHRQPLPFGSSQEQTASDVACFNMGGGIFSCTNGSTAVIR